MTPSEEELRMRLILIVTVAATGLGSLVWADGPKKETPIDGAKTTKLVIKDMT